MEEWIGKIWHRLITGSARKTFPEAAVELDDMRKTVGVVFRALGGDGGLRIEAASPTRHGARRSWLQRVAGTNLRVELAWRDQQALYLPLRLDVFPSSGLNRDLYIWLAALSSEHAPGRSDWFAYNQWLTRRVLHRFPGLDGRYRRLVQAQFAVRPDPAVLAAAEGARERAIRQALVNPGTATDLPEAPRAPEPVYLWLHPSPPAPAGGEPDEPGQEQDPEDNGNVHQPGEQRRRQAERVDMPDGKSGLVLDRFENIFGWAEYVKVDRTTDEEEDLDAAEQAAEDLDVMSVARDTRAGASRIRFDLDLPSAASDDTPLGQGILFPEWDYRRARMQPDYCRIQPMVAADAQPMELPRRLSPVARRLRAQFESLQPARTWFRGQQDGTEVDLHAYIDYTGERLRGHAAAEQGLYRSFRNGSRDLACVLLADLSLSTDTWVNDTSRVVDVIRDSLFLFAESLNATGDRFAMYGFSSKKRDHVRVHTLKAFGEGYSPEVRGRIQAIRPGFYTRMGAALRYATDLLSRQPATQKLLLLLTDGKPNDLDQYESRYGVEDTRMSVMEARRQGLQPFCVTIDEQSGDYLPHLFGSDGYVVIRRPSELPRELPLLYARLTQ